MQKNVIYQKYIGICVLSNAIQGHALHAIQLIMISYLFGSIEAGRCIN
jgi:hypothetical protein